MEERLQKIISAAGLMSRRAAEEKIAAGAVKINGVTAALGDKADVQRDLITVDGKAVAPCDKKVYIMLNKPKGYVTTMSDEKGRRSVCELVRELPLRVYPVGRLDINSEGLLIMTNDGEFANRVMHPSKEVDKTYRTSVRGGDIDAAAEMLRGEMEIDGYTVRPAEVRIEKRDGDRAVLLITIHEGRNRQVRKMCALAGLEVKALCRVSEGGVELGSLGSGKWRYLTAEEIDKLKE